MRKKEKNMFIHSKQANAVKHTHFFTPCLLLHITDVQSKDTVGATGSSDAHTTEQHLAATAANLLLCSHVVPAVRDSEWNREQRQEAGGVFREENGVSLRSGGVSRSFLLKAACALSRHLFTEHVFLLM